MVRGPDIALAASTRPWPDRLHRFILDHGGARVTDRIMQPDQLQGAAFDVLIIDDVSSVLSRGLVDSVRRRGGSVVGVFESADAPTATRRLTECGISDVIPADADPTEFLAIVERCSASAPSVPPAAGDSRRSRVVGVTGPTAGVGITEIAVGIAWEASRGASVVLVDLDLYWPSIAQRLDLPVHPNVMTTLDAILHRPPALTETLHAIGGLVVCPGTASKRGEGTISRPDLVMLVESLGDMFDLVVLDLGPHDRISPGFMREVDGVVVVGAADPVGIGRLVRAVDRLAESHESIPVLALVNRSPGGYQGAEIGRQLDANLPSHVPHVRVGTDRRLAEASWNGQIKQSRHFRRSMQRVAGATLEVKR